MEQKPKQIWILIIMWLIIGICFTGMIIYETSIYIESLKIYEEPTFLINDQISRFNAFSNFSYASSLILSILIMICSFLLAYTSFYVKKWTWILGIILASALLYSVYIGIVGIGGAILMNDLLKYFSNLMTIAITLLIFIVPYTIYLLTRPEVRNYLEKN